MKFKSKYKIGQTVYVHSDRECKILTGKVERISFEDKHNALYHVSCPGITYGDKDEWDVFDSVEDAQKAITVQG